MPKEMKVSLKGYDDVLNEIQSMKSKSEKVVNRTVADFKSRGPGWVAQEVVREYNVKKSDINKDKKDAKRIGTVKVGGAKLDNLCIIYRGKPLTLTHFSMTPKKPPKLTDKRVKIYIPGKGFRNVRQRAKIQIRATIYRGKQETITGKYNTPVFIQENPKKAGQYLPFQRTGEKTEDRNGNKTEKDAFVSIKSASIEQMIENETVAGNIKFRINEGLGKRLEHHLKQAMK